MKKGLIKGAAALLGLLAVSEAGASAYFYREDHEEKPPERGADHQDVRHGLGAVRADHARSERTICWPSPTRRYGGYRRTAFGSTPRFSRTRTAKRLPSVLHGYTSQGMSDYIGLSGYYLKHGFAMFLPDARAHGQSEGEYVGFGCLDRYDLLGWIHWIVERCGEDVQILLHGTSMGGATVLMASGLKLPPQVKGIVSDCGFTSPKAVFTHVLHSMYHLPAFPMIPIASAVNRRKAGYGLDDCNAAREVRKAKVPVLLIHGSADSFVPCRMCEEIYENCASPKKKLIIEGAAHAESYYKDPENYEKALDEFIGGILKMMRKRKGYPVYPLTCRTEISTSFTRTSARRRRCSISAPA